MRWVVELPAPSGGTAATVTVESDSWAGALSSARGGVSIRKFRCEFESEGVVRVHDLEANERYTVRPYRASTAPAAPEPTPPVEAPAPTAVLRSPSVPPASGRPSRVPQAASSGSFSVAPPPGTSVPLPARSSTPPVSPVAADPTDYIDVPSGVSGTVVGMFLSPAAAAKLEAAAPAATVAEKVSEPAPAVVENAPEPAVVEKAPEPVAAVAEKAPEPVAVVVPEAAPVAVETPVVAEPAKPVVVDDLSVTTVDRPIFVAPAAPTPTVAETPTTSRPTAEPASSSTASNGSPSEAPVVPTTVLFERDQDPGPTNPLTYRERVLCVAEGTSVIEAEAVARQTLMTLKRSLATRPRGRYVNVAVFDHRFSQRPAHPPLVVLRWRDWRGDLPEMQIKPALAPVAAPAPPAAAVEAPVVNGKAVTEADVAAPQPETTTHAEPVVAVAEVSPAAPAAVVVEPTLPTAAVAEIAAPNVTPETPFAAPEAAVEAPVAVTSPVETAAPAVAETAAETAPGEPQPPVVEAPAATETAAAVEATPADVAATPVATEAVVVPDAVAPPAVVAATETAATPDAPVAEPSMSLAPEASDEPVAAETKPVAEGAASVPPAAETPAAPVAPAADRKRFTGGRRGPDLLSDLFDGLMELSFLKDPTDICAFVAGILTQHLRCDAVLVFSYDINRDEFVVHGEANTGRLDHRVGAKVGSYGAAARSKRALAVAEAHGTDLTDPACDGGAALFAPGLVRDRLFALVHVARLPGSPAFEADEVDAASYIAGQLAEALASQSHRQAVADLAEKRDARR